MHQLKAQGEAGRGFAVVADDCQLAEKTRFETENIANILKNFQKMRKVAAAVNTS